MTATNHALTGAAIALVIKKPELAIPLAFVSHFVLDAIPHYNPQQINKQTFKNYGDSWRKKFSRPLFLYIFAGDMVLFALILLSLPFAAPSGVSGWTIFFSAFAAASPDFIGGRYVIYKLVGYKPKKIKNSLFTKFHIWVQWMERPWGMGLEFVWFGLMIWLIHNLVR